MAHKISWEPMPPLRGKLSKNTQVIYKRDNATKQDYTSVIRKKRNYETNPLSDAEASNRLIFLIAKTPGALTPTPEIVAAFKAQKKYKTLGGYQMALTIRSLKERFATNEYAKAEFENLLHIFKTQGSKGVWRMMSTEEVGNKLQELNND